LRAAWRSNPALSLPQAVPSVIIDVLAAGADPHPVMVKLLGLLLRALLSAVRDRAELAIENLALRQQLATFASSGRRPASTLPTAGSGFPSADGGRAGSMCSSSSSPRRSFGGTAPGFVATGHGCPAVAARADRRSIAPFAT